MTDSPTKGNTHAVMPMVIDLGKTSRKKAKQLKKGKGPLMDQVALAIQQVKEQLGKDVDSGILPVVVLFKEKSKKRTAFPLF